jgi:hypothetical protein
MGEITKPSQVLLLVAVSSCHEEAFHWARQRATQQFGQLATASTLFDFNETDYYLATMGPNLKKQFLICDEPFEPGRLSTIKQMTNDWEAEYAALCQHSESRPLNLDPGYLTLAKLVLASTKDHAHRIYLNNGIYAEVTLAFRQGAWQKFAWTFPDYQREDYQQFFSQCRNDLRKKLRSGYPGI